MIKLTRAGKKHALEVFLSEEKHAYEILQFNSNIHVFNQWTTVPVTLDLILMYVDSATWTNRRKAQIYLESTNTLLAIVYYRNLTDHETNQARKETLT